MKILKKVKANLFFAIVVLTYVILFIVRPDIGVESVKSSGYYIKEMLVIMPVIFVLTALLDLWIPKEKITRFLGRDSGVKGVVLSFVVGSVSAGPVYAAFPMCVMLHKKGASIRNLLVILSAWAVIKIPMLINEARFLGLRFMAVRWVLTVVAVVIMSWIAGKIIKDEDLPFGERAKDGPGVNREACPQCAEHSPEPPEMGNGKAAAKPCGDLGADSPEKEMEACPAEAEPHRG